MLYKYSYYITLLLLHYIDIYSDFEFAGMAAVTCLSDDSWSLITTHGNVYLLRLLTWTMAHRIGGGWACACAPQVPDHQQWFGLVECKKLLETV